MVLVDVSDVDDVCEAVPKGVGDWLGQVDDPDGEHKQPQLFADVGERDGPVFSTFVKPWLGPTVDVQSDHHAANGTTDFDLADAPRPLEVWTEMVKWTEHVTICDPVVLVAHDGNRFDLPFLTHRLRRDHKAPPTNVTHLVDPMQVVSHEHPTPRRTARRPARQTDTVSETWTPCTFFLNVHIFT